MKQILIVLIILLAVGSSYGQKGFDLERDSALVQFSGLVLTDNGKNLEPVPYTTVSVLKQGRGTYSNYKGFFSIVVHKGDKVKFSAIGFKPVIFTIPDTLTGKRYSVVQLMTQDEYNLPETVIFPWPDRDHFKLEFLAMDVTEELQEQAKENLATEQLALVRERTVMDANENSDYYLRQEAQSFYHIGQTPPMNIFNPIAWGQFFQSWKNGDFKKKKK